jgi:Ca-activated chloride channel family protein
LMNEKNYSEAVEAYKNALRNNPTDDESRYNLALAKDMLEKNPPQDDKGDDENKDKDDKKEDDSENKEGDDGDQKEDQEKGDEKEDKKEGEDEKDKGKPDEPKDQDKKPQEQKPQPGQLSPQQVKSLLEAMNNEEEKVQQKINAQKQKGAKVKSNKDW